MLIKIRDAFIQQATELEQGLRLSPEGLICVNLNLLGKGKHVVLFIF
jgi:hypothetical protein